MNHGLHWLLPVIGGLACLLLATPARAGELVNPGFEMGNLTGWTGWPTPALATVETTATAHGGAKVARVAFNGINNFNTVIQDIAAPATQFTPGSFYLLKVWYRYQTDQAIDNPALTLHYEDGQGKLIGDYNNTVGLSGSTATWHSMQLIFHALDAPKMRISLRGGMNSQAHGVAWFDDVSIQKVTEPPHDLEIYLLLGQSNMVGMDKDFIEEDQTPHPRVFMLTAGNAWAPAVEPLHGVGVGPGFAFGKAMADASPDRMIGLVPLAAGSTAISQWVKGAGLYVQALAKAQVARQQGTIKGIVWHQGESDSYDAALAQAYPAQIKGLVKDLRADLGQPQLPFVCGELGRFLGSAYASTVSAALLDLPRQAPLVAAVSSEDLTNLDPWHFNAASQRTFGRRYAQEMIELQKKATTRVLAWQAYDDRAQ